MTAALLLAAAVVATTGASWAQAGPTKLAGDPDVTTTTTRPTSSTAAADDDAVASAVPWVALAGLVVVGAGSGLISLQRRRRGG